MLAGTRTVTCNMVALCLSRRIPKCASASLYMQRVYSDDVLGLLLSSGLYVWVTASLREIICRTPPRHVSLRFYSTCMLCCCAGPAKPEKAMTLRVAHGGTQAFQCNMSVIHDVYTQAKAGDCICIEYPALLSHAAVSCL